MVRARKAERWGHGCIPCEVLCGREQLRAEEEDFSLHVLERRGG